MNITSWSALQCVNLICTVCVLSTRGRQMSKKRMLISISSHMIWWDVIQTDICWRCSYVQGFSWESQCDTDAVMIVSSYSWLIYWIKQFSTLFFSVCCIVRICVWKKWQVSDGFLWKIGGWKKMSVDTLVFEMHLDFVVSVWCVCVRVWVVVAVAGSCGGEAELSEQCRAPGPGGRFTL